MFHLKLCCYPLVLGQGCTIDVLSHLFFIDNYIQLSYTNKLNTHSCKLDKMNVIKENSSSNNKFLLISFPKALNKFSKLRQYSFSLSSKNSQWSLRWYIFLLVLCKPNITPLKSYFLFYQHSQISRI